MDILTFDRLVTLGLFMAALGAAWIFVHRNKHGLSRKLAQGRRLQVQDTLALGANQRAVLLAVDGREFLVVQGKGGNCSVQPLGGPAAGAQA